MTHNAYLGADPEIFLVDSKDQIVSASTIINGAVKYNDQEIINDGMQIELHPTYSSCRESLVLNLFNCLKYAYTLASSKNLRLSHSFAKNVSKNILKSLPKEVQALGCEPDMSIYSGSVKILNIDGSKHFKRYCGGHIHFGTNQENIKNQIHDSADEIVRLFDYFVGNTFVLLDHNEENVERRKVYGQAGSYRLQKHGIEYRVLSNYWLSHPSLVSLVFGLGRLATKFARPTYEHYQRKSTIHDFIKAVPEKDIENAINYNDYKLAEHNAKKIFKLLLQEKYIEDLTEVKLKYLIHLNNNEEDFPFKNKSIVENWRLDTENNPDRSFLFGWDSFTSMLTYTFNFDFGKLNKIQL